MAEIDHYTNVDHKRKKRKRTQNATRYICTVQYLFEVEPNGALLALEIFLARPARVVFAVLVAGQFGLAPVGAAAGARRPGVVRAGFDSYGGSVGGVNAS